MESALVSVATGAMKPLLEKLSKLLEEEYSKVKNVRREAGFIRNEMQAMSATLQMLADSEELDPQTKIWRDDVRDTSYDMEDCVDRFTACVDEQDDGHGHSDVYTGLKKFFLRLKKLKPRHEFANEFKQLKDRALDISERHKRYNIGKPTPGSDPNPIDPRLPALYVEVDKLVGIDERKKQVTDKLELEDSSSTVLKVVSIFGSGGLGKTTIANQVFQSIKNQFECTALVSVSRKPDTRRILRVIAEQVGATLNTSDDDVKQLIDKVRDHLQDKRFFVVIDDVWDTEAWKTISLALPSNNRRSRIIITTRNVTVASRCSSQGCSCEMKPLSSADSERLFYKRAFNSEDLCYPHLKEVSDEILKKCAGLPLAIITISSLLADQTAKDEWERVLKAIGSAIAKDPSAGNMTKIISLSYFDLPHHLRTCLLYLSVYPEDYIIDKQLLISRWISEGFIHEDEQGRSMYELGEGYFNDLVNRSLIHPVGVKYGQAEACQVHDIILDFIRCKAAEENFVTPSDAWGDGNNSGHKVRRFFFEGISEKDITSTRLILSHLRSCTILGEFVPASLLEFDFPAVRVLDLGDCWWLEDHHIKDILKLSLLKYLRLGKSSILELPREIGDLQHLQTLDIRRIRTRELPSTITKLQQLARLFVRQGTKFPDGIIGQMKSLEELDEYSVFTNEQAKALQEFGQLTKLRTLKVAWCADISDGSEGSDYQDLQCYVRSLTSSGLHHLYLINSYSRAPDVYPLILESWCPTLPCSIRKLHIAHSYIDQVPSWMGSLESLRELKLYIYSARLEDFAILGAMPALLSLELSILHGGIERMLISGFRSLKYLELEFSRGGGLTEFVEGSMPKLDQLKLEFAIHKSGFPNGPSDFGIQHLSALTKAEVSIHNDSDVSSRLAADKVATLIDTAVRTLPSRPTLSLQTGLTLEEVDEKEFI